MIIRFAIIVIILALFIGCASTLYEKINIVGDNSINGIFDPSIEYDNNGTGWMVYSSIEAPKYISTNLAKSLDNGKTWTYVSTINEATDDDSIVEGGVWRHEVPTLLYDANDSGKEWKLYWHKYLVKPPYESSDRLFEYGWIAYKYASNPEGNWSDEISLFGANQYPLNPYMIEFDLSDLDSDLNNYLFYSEPGSVIIDDTIYLCFDGSTNVSGMYEWENRTTFLISSNDHGQTWKYNGILTDYNDCYELRYRVFTGSSLVTVNNQNYLLTSPSGSFNKLNKDHDGTYIFKFIDISNAKLERDSNEKLIVYGYLKDTLSSGGQSDYDELNTNGGVMMPQINIKRYPKIFELYNTKELI